MIMPELEKDRFQAKGDIREILDRLAEKHGATVRDVTAAMLSIDDTLRTCFTTRSECFSRNRGSDPDLIEAR
jgi:hypothetical protein